MRSLTGDAKYYALLAERSLTVHNATYAEGYRTHDEHGVKEHWPTHLDLGDFLEKASASFPAPIDVLDLACGCGRYFHRIQHVLSLTGVDLSPDMLEQAKRPVNAERLTFPITLLCQNVSALDLPAERFDFVYAIGIYGVCLPLDAYLLSSALACVRPGGRFAFSVTDRASRHQATSWKRRFAEQLAPWMPVLAQRWIRTRLFSFAISEAELRALLEGLCYRIQYRETPSGFKDFLVIVDKGGTVCSGGSSRR